MAPAIPQSKSMPGTPTAKLDALADAVDDLLDSFPKMKLPDKIDAAARLRAVAKILEKIDTEVKDAVKEHRNGAKEEWFVLGRLFKAKGTVTNPERLDQKLLKEDYPRAHAACLVTKEQETITFEVR